MKLDGFEILGELGHGGMATVYRARQISLNREVAIKVFEPRFEPTSEDREKFQNEAIVAARLKHPGIVQIHDAVFTGEVYCFVMELVRGYTVSQLAARRGKLDETSLLDIATAVAVALGYAWSQHGVIHCDIKPDNLMVDSDGTIKILDLGLAKTAKALRGTGAEEMVYGTPQYISPEQARGQDDLDCRADIYSLGATLYQLATGRVLFPNVADAQIVECQISGKAPNPHTLNSKLSLGFCSLLEKMLAKDRVRRQTDWDVVLRDVGAVRAGLPIQSGPPLPDSSTIESGPALTFFPNGRPPSGRLVRRPRQSSAQDPMVPSAKASPPVKPPPPPALHEAPVPKIASGRGRGMLDELAIALKANLPILLGGSLAAVAVVSIAVAAAVVSLRTPNRRNTNEPTPDLDSPIPLTLEAIGDKSPGDGGSPTREVSDIPVSDTPDAGRTPQPRTTGMAEEGTSNKTMDGGPGSEALSSTQMTVAPTEIVDVLADVSAASTDKGSPSEAAPANVDALRENTASMSPSEVRPMTSLGLGTKRSEPSGNTIETGQWTQDYDAALALAADRRIPVLLNFTGSDWCGACIRIHKEVLSREEFLTWSKDRIALVTIDRPNDASLVPPEFHSRNMRLRDTFGIRGYPTFVVLNPDGQEIGRIVGSGDGRTVGSFKRRIVEIAGDLPVRPPKVRTEELMRLLSFSADDLFLKPLEAFSGKLLDALDRKRMEADAKRKSMHGKIQAAAEKAK
ncbi:MAG: protein kinase, partial [Kiritimatiellae bacterium]|nr:protein kinase [Kiritimatiellia bacterium]